MKFCFAFMQRNFNHLKCVLEISCSICSSFWKIRILVHVICTQDPYTCHILFVCSSTNKSGPETRKVPDSNPDTSSLRVSRQCVKQSLSSFSFCHLFCLGFIIFCPHLLPVSGWSSVFPQVLVQCCNVRRGEHHGCPS